MDALSEYTGVSTANAIVPTAMPLSILADTSTPTNVAMAPYTLESLSPEQSSVLASYSIPSVLSYTMSDSSVTVPSTGSGAAPSVAPFFNSDGSIGYTTLPGSRLVSATMAAGSGMTTAATSTNGTASVAQPTNYNPNSASSMVTKNGVAVLLLVITAFIL